MKNILITGGAGYIGSHTIKYLSQRGFFPVTLDNLCTGFKSNIHYGDFYQSDFFNLDLLHQLHKKYNFKAIIHLAAHAEVEESIYFPDKYFFNNSISSKKLIEFAQSEKIENFIFSSSGATYGVTSKRVIKETHPQQPMSPYGESKLITEKDLQKSSLNYVILRYFNAAGADPQTEIGECHEPETHLVPNMIKAYFNQSSFSVYGNSYDTHDGSCIRDFVHVWDIAQAHHLALKHVLSQPSSLICNLGSEQGFSVIETLQCCEETLNQLLNLSRKIQVKIRPKRPGDPPYLVASSAQARQRLGWNPQYTSLEYIIRHASLWYMKHSNIDSKAF